MKKLLTVSLSIIVVISLMLSVTSCGKVKKNSKDRDDDTETEESADLSDSPNGTADGSDDSQTGERETQDSETEAPDKTPDPADMTDKEIYELYLSAAEKTNAPDDVHIKQSSKNDMSLKISGVPDVTEQSSNTVTDSRYCDRHSSNILLEMHSTDVESSRTTDVYFDGSNYYIRRPGEDFVTVPKTDSGIQAQALNAVISEDNFLIRILPEAAFENASIKIENRTTVITIAPDPDTIRDGYSDAMAQFDDLFARLGATDVSTVVSSAEFTFVISEDGYIINLESSILFSMEMTILSYNATADVVASSVMEIIDPGKPVTIEFPEV